jgi:hypothetical protein
MGNMALVLFERRRSEMAKKRLFVDMEGTLCTFRPVKTLEMLYTPGYFRDLPPQEPIVDAVKRIIKDHAEDIEVYVLTSYLSDSPYAVKEKMEWLDEYLPEVDCDHRIFVKCGYKKSYLSEWQRATLFSRSDGTFASMYTAYSELRRDITEDDFLLDDYTKNLIDWEPPGRGIKLLNGINHTRGTWQGSTTYKGCTSEDITKDIIGIADGKTIQYPVARYVRQKEEIEQAALLHEQRMEYVKSRIEDTLSVYNIAERDVEAFMRQSAVKTVAKALYSLNLSIDDIKFYLTESGLDEHGWHNSHSAWHGGLEQTENKPEMAIKNSADYKNYINAREIVSFIYSRDSVKYLQILGKREMMEALKDVPEDVWEETVTNEKRLIAALSDAGPNKLKHLRAYLETNYAMPSAENSAKPAEYRPAPHEGDEREDLSAAHGNDESER